MPKLVGGRISINLYVKSENDLSFERNSQYTYVSAKRANQAPGCSAASRLADKQKRRFARVSALSNNGKSSVTVQLREQVRNILTHL